MWYVVVWLGLGSTCLSDSTADELCGRWAAHYGMVLDETPELQDGTRACVMH